MIQAISILDAAIPLWEVCDVSQNLFRMPVRTLSYKPFMCITPDTQFLNKMMLNS